MNTLPSKRKPYKQPLGKNWWLKNDAYRQYMLRSATSIAIILYALNLFCALTALSLGEQQFNAWLQFQQTPISIILHIFGLVAVIYNTKTWFMLAPKTVHVQLGDNKVSDKQIETIMWVVWVAVTVVVSYILLSNTF